MPNGSTAPGNVCPWPSLPINGSTLATGLGAAACIETYVMAMQAAKSIKPEAVREALAAADFDTQYAHIKFTPEGDGDPLNLGGMIGQVQKGKLETVFPEKAKSADAVYPAQTWDKKA